jgi:rod shape-determining protein MreB
VALWGVFPGEIKNLLWGPTCACYDSSLAVEFKAYWFLKLHLDEMFVRIMRIQIVILDTILGLFSLDMGIDLGTCNTLVCVRGEGIVLNEPSVVAVKKGTNRVLQNGNAVGVVAKEMLGKTPGSISAIRPLKDGVISDFEITEAMLGYFIRKVHGRRGLIRPRVVISVPSGITAVEKRAVLDSAERAGARKVYLVQEPMAAGIGAGLPITEPTASMIVDIGGGTTEVAIMSLADISVRESVRIAGDDMDESIINHLKRTYNLLIGEARAEKIKIEVGSAAPLDEELTMEISGRDTISGLPRKIVITSEEIRECLKEPISQIVDTVTRTLERAEPELAADLIDNGICLAGGGALLRRIDTVLANATGLKVIIADDPLTCVARGTSVYLENLELWKDTLESDDTTL